MEGDALFNLQVTVVMSFSIDKCKPGQSEIDMLKTTQKAIDAGITADDLAAISAYILESLADYSIDGKLLDGAVRSNTSKQTG
jgi:hypothetical protein